VHGVRRLLATEPPPSEDDSYCWHEGDIAASREYEGLPAAAVESLHEDTQLCFACQAQRAPEELARLGYTPEARRRVTPLLRRASALSPRH
jgi:hypothetical protein